MTEQSYTVPSNSRAARADKILARAFPEHSRVAFQRSFDAGLVKIDGQAIARDRTVLADTVVSFSFPDLRPSDIKAVDIPLDVIYEDKHLLAVNKTAGMVVHPGAGTGEDTLVHALLAHCKGKLSGVGGVERPGIVHRLDRETSGVIIVAKSDLAHRGLADQFKERELHKEYLALVTGASGLLSGSIKKAIGRNQQHRHKMTTIDEDDESGRGREAHTDWVVVESFGKIATLMRCIIHTGRTHQIRVHMKALGHVVQGDEIYGWKPDPRLPKQPGRVMLHAENLVVTHPISGKELNLKAPLPADFKAQIAQLRKLTRGDERRKLLASLPPKKKTKPVPPPAHVREQS